MASIISAGTTSGTSLNLSGDTSGVLQLATNGSTTAMTINTSQNVGIGTTSPSFFAGGGLQVSNATQANLRLSDTTNAAYNFDLFMNDADAYAVNRTSGPIVFGTNNTERMRITSGGFVGIGRTDPDAMLCVKSASATQNVLRMTGSTTSETYLEMTNTGGAFYVGKDNSAGTAFGAVYSANLYSGGAYPMLFWTNSTEKMRITSGGNVLINTTAVVVDGTSRLAVSNTTTNGVAAEFSNNTSGTCAVAINNSGAATSTLINWIAAGAYRSAVTWNGTNIIYGTPSDQRLKENIVDSSSALPLINDIKIRSFDWKENGNHIEFGVIAQELESVMPEAVLKGKDNEDGSIKESWSVDTSTLVPALIKAIQEQQAMIETLQAEVAALKGVN